MNEDQQIRAQSTEYSQVELIIRFHQEIFQNWRSNSSVYHTIMAWPSDCWSHNLILRTGLLAIHSTLNTPVCTYLIYIMYVKTSMHAYRYITMKIIPIRSKKGTYHVFPSIRPLQSHSSAYSAQPSYGCSLAFNGVDHPDAKTD
jgi:hypothetical protein